ncbi:MAG: glycosyltransferase [Planctomycetaceae bacterium]
MSHIILASVGTHGDVLPYVALGIACKARGHRVTLAANESYAPLAREHGLEFAALVSNAETDELLDDPNLWHPIKSGLLGARWGRKSLRRQYDQLAELAAGDDVVLATSVAILAGRLLQETRGLPLATIYHIPWTIASSSEPPVMTGGWTLPKWAPRPVARAYWWLVDFNARVLLGNALNELRSTLGLPPVKRLFRWWTSPELAVGLFPDWYAPPQPDWPSQLITTGFPRFDGETDGELAAEVLDFCQSGPPPVVVTFGTGMKHAAKLFMAAAEACAKSGRRGLLLARFADQVPLQLPSGVRHFQYASLRQLLPHCSTIVHHGGIGTTAKSVTSGTPQVIVPHAWDQLDNAMRVARLGVGVTLRRRHVTSTRLAASLKEVEAASVLSRCRAVAAAGAVATDPMQTAAILIEQLCVGRPAVTSS